MLPCPMLPRWLNSRCELRLMGRSRTNRAPSVHPLWKSRPVGRGSADNLAPRVHSRSTDDGDRRAKARRLTSSALDVVALVITVRSYQSSETANSWRWMTGASATERDASNARRAILQWRAHCLRHPCGRSGVWPARRVRTRRSAESRCSFGRLQAIDPTKPSVADVVRFWALTHLTRELWNCARLRRALLYDSLAGELRR